VIAFKEATMSEPFLCPNGHRWDGDVTTELTAPCPVCGAAGKPEWLTIHIGLTISRVPVQMHIPVPTSPVRPIDLLPQFRAVAETLVQIGVRRVKEEGEAISCKKGCGACCRQLVPISEIEAPRIRAVVDALPEPRRTEVRRRFADARRRLEEAGLLEKLEHAERFPDLKLRTLGQDYFILGIPCPFLEDESCSIYEERPVSCREYLVTSPAENCKQPTAETIRCVPLSAKVSTAMTRIEEDPRARFTRWVPLILAPDWAETHADAGAPRPGPELLRELFQRLLEPSKPQATDAGEN
jgi:Fe-S-cluster containining protein